jgi:hypothetical protein
MILEAVQHVLTALDEQGLADYGEAWAGMVADRLEVLKGAYENLTDENRALIDYSDLPTQAAYMFRYVLCRAEFAYQVLRRARTASAGPLFDTEELWVTSVGGGPGSELLGLLKYLAEGEGEPTVTKIIYTVIDKEKNWEHVTDLLVQTIQNQNVEVKMFYQEFDVTKDSLPNHITLKKEELCMMSFFISEVCALPEAENVRKNVRDLLGTMPNQSIFLCNDSKAISFIKFLKARVSAARKFDEIVDVDETLICSLGHLDGIFQEYIDDYGYMPHLNSKALAKVYRRNM